MYKIVNIANNFFYIQCYRQINFNWKNDVNNLFKMILHYGNQQMI